MVHLFPRGAHEHHHRFQGLGTVCISSILSFVHAPTSLMVPDLASVDNICMDLGCYELQ